jgi:Polyferredoxin
MLYYDKFYVKHFATFTLVFGRRAGCHYFCWMSPFMIIGSKIKNKLNYPSLKLKADQGKCVSCNVCTKQCPMSLDVKEMVKKQDMNNSECIMCGMCVDSCNKKAIKFVI